MNNYVEEENFGLDLQPTAVCPANKTCFAISGRHVLSYDAETGARLQLLAHSEPVVGAHFVDKKFITITKSGTVVSWDWKNGKELHRTDASEDFCLRWSYEVTLAGSETPDIIVYAQSVTKCGDEPMEVDESSSDNSTCHAAKTSLLQLNLIDADENQFRVTLTSLIDVPDVIPSRRHLAVGANFVAVVRGCDLKIIPLAHFRGKINGPLAFNHQMKFNVPDSREVAFCEVHAHDDAVFAAVNVGRMYFWSQIRECGLHQNNKTYVDASSCRFAMAVAGGQSVFTGDGTSNIARWNLLSTGVGRLRHGEYLRMAAPVERLHLSANAALLLAVLSDNSLHVIRTASLTVQCQVEGVRWNELASPLDWARLTVDPSLQQVVTNGRLGHLQWIDPVKWKTMSEFDVSEENTPPRDHFSAQNYLWSNVYMVHLTAKRLVTCERRRSGFDKTYMKIYRRMHEKTTTDFRLEECVVCPQRVSFICSSGDEAIGVSPAAAATSSSSVTSQKELEGGQNEIVRILEGGQIDVFVPDAYRVGRWRIDPNRQRVSWRKSVIRACSRVYSSAFATINETPVGRANGKLDLDDLCRSSRFDSSITSASLHSSTDDEEQRDEPNGRRTHVLLWQLPVTLRIFQIFDCVADATQVEWAPPNLEGKAHLLVAGSQGIFGYNPEIASLTWRVERPGLSLFASQLTCFAYDSNAVVFFDSTSGRLKKVLKFTNPQEQIVGCGFNRKNIAITGLSRNGICVLKTKKAQNQAQSVAQLLTKKTPFSQLVAKSSLLENGLQNGKGDYVQLEAKIPAASKIFDGPAHTLAPIVQLAPLYIRSCLAMRRKD